MRGIRAFLEEVLHLRVNAAKSRWRGRGPCEQAKEVAIDHDLVKPLEPDEIILLSVGVACPGEWDARIENVHLRHAIVVPENHLRIPAAGVWRR
jgi:hypothetical protein